MPNTEIARSRLLAQRIAGPKLATPADVVRWLGPLQAQDYQASLWAIGLRTQTATLSDIDAAVEGRAIVRTWPMRGTLHWLPAEDLRWMVALMAPRAMAKSAGRRRQLEIDDAVLRRARKLFERHLRDSASMTRPEAYALLAADGLAPESQRGIHILQILAHEAFLCMGPHRGKQPTFVLADLWLPAFPAKPRDEGLAELARRYFASHGPATVHDFAWWTGLTVADARRGLASADRELERVVFDGREYWRAPAAGRARPGGAVHLLPGFDEFILGYTDRTAVLSPEQSRRIFPGANGMFLAALVSDAGEVLGTWRKSIGKQAVSVTPELFAGTGPPAGFDHAVRRYADFLGLAAATA